MTNNDELALKMKDVARHSVDGYGRQDISYNDPEGEFVFYSDHAALAEALEAAKKRIAGQDKSIAFLKEQLSLLANFNPDWDKLEAAYDSLREHMAALNAAQSRIAELEALIAEQDKRMITYADIATKNASEARTVRVKLPESVIDAICLTAAEIHNLGRGVSDERAQDIIDSIRCAAGIKLEVEE